MNEAERGKSGLRRGLLAEVNRVFDDAESKLGGGHPDDYEPEKERLGKLRREVLTLLRKAGRREGGEP